MWVILDALLSSVIVYPHVLRGVSHIPKITLSFYLHLSPVNQSTHTPPHLRIYLSSRLTTWSLFLPCEIYYDLCYSHHPCTYPYYSITPPCHPWLLPAGQSTHTPPHLRIYLSSRLTTWSLFLACEICYDLCYSHHPCTYPYYSITPP